MILADTSVWIDHLRHDDDRLRASLEAREVLCHPLIVGEIAMGSLKNRAIILRFLGQLPRAQRANDEEVRALVEGRRLFGLGLGYIDAHLLAATLLTPEAVLWTRDRRLRAAAKALGVADVLN